jgi:methyltransferase
MQLVYPGAFVTMAGEGWWRALPVDAWFAMGVIVWGLSKALKYAAIRALGERWCFRVLVLAEDPLVTSGPYRRARHPNYIAVIGELIAMGLMCPAPISGPVLTGAFALLIRRRIHVEERALGLER